MVVPSNEFYVDFSVILNIPFSSRHQNYQHVFLRDQILKLNRFLIEFSRNTQSWQCQHLSILIPMPIHLC